MLEYINNTDIEFIVSVFIIQMLFIFWYYIFALIIQWFFKLIKEIKNV